MCLWFLFQLFVFVDFFEKTDPLNNPLVSEPCFLLKLKRPKQWGKTKGLFWVLVLPTCFVCLFLPVVLGYCVSIWNLKTQTLKQRYCLHQLFQTNVSVLMLFFHPSRLRRRVLLRWLLYHPVGFELTDAFGFDFSVKHLPTLSARGVQEMLPSSLPYCESNKTR